MSDSAKAVFLSYASQDAAAAQRVCDALRAAGVEVWFDQSELVGGDAWDAKIRSQIKSCALFVPLISANTNARREGYFRREWKLAVDRTNDMDEGLPFLVPVVIDGTTDAGAFVPEKFREVQWTRLPGGETNLAWCTRVAKLVGVGESVPMTPTRGASAVTLPAAATQPARPRWLIPAVALGIAVAGLAAWRPWQTRPVDPPAAATSKPTPPANAPAPAAVAAGTVAPLEEKSVAVLAFADLSEGKNSEHLSDGISEELLNVLAKVPGLKVSARTSAFFFKGKNLPIPEIAQKLNVAYVLEGSVQRSGERVKITAQLIKAADGFHVWSDAFTRDLKDVFALQDEIAGVIAQQLQLKLGVNAGAAAVVSPKVLELYLQGRQAWNLRTDAGKRRAADLLNQAIALEPTFARAHSALADVSLVREYRPFVFRDRDSKEIAEIRRQIERALALDPNLGEAYASLGALYWNSWRLEEGERALRQAVLLNPNYATAHQWLGRVLVSAGRLEEGYDSLRRAAELDPLSHRIVDNLFIPLVPMGRWEEALAVAERALVLQPDSPQALTWKVTALSWLGRREETASLVRRSDTDNPTFNVWGTAALARVGLRREAEAFFAKKIEGREGVLARHLALAALGRMEEAMAVMNESTLSIQPWNEVLFDPSFDPVRTDPRFVKLLATLGMTEVHARAQAWRAAHPLPVRKITP